MRWKYKGNFPEQREFLFYSQNDQSDKVIFHEKVPLNAFQKVLFLKQPVYEKKIIAMKKKWKWSGMKYEKIFAIRFSKFYNFRYAYLEMVWSLSLIYKLIF